MANIKFSYLYRDSCNYKNYRALIFANPNNVDLDELKNLIKCKLVDYIWFYHDEWQVPNLRFDDWCIEVDPTWHEFESIEYSNELANTSKKLAELIYCINGTADSW
ncbi:MAG: hypothetical protein V4560_15570 [Bacteroidota bacterium]